MRLLALLLALCCATSLLAQLTDTFDDGNITDNPTWLGSVSDYAVIDGACRLNATDAGSSYIYTSVSYPDSVQFDFSFEINTNPSAGNFSRVYLALDDPDLTVANGYYVQLGESGSDDAIRLYSLTAGSPTELAAGAMARIATRPAYDVRIVIDSNGSLDLSIREPGSGLYTPELFTMIDWVAYDSGYFGLGNTYTGSNTSAYAYDNISIAAFVPDTSPPMIVSATVVDDMEVLLTFDEPIDETSLTRTDFEIDNGLTITGATMPAPMSNVVSITVDAAIQSGPQYTVTASDLDDLNGNTIITTTVTFRRAVSPSPGDLVINELLFNPEGSGSDYVELLNVSDKILSIQGVSLRNTTNDQAETILSDRLLLADEIVLLTEDVAGTTAAYATSDPKAMLQSNLPAMNNGDGNITVEIGGLVLDAVDYDEDWHFGLLDDVDGVSLERIDPSSESNNPDNWQSAAATVGYGTPGLPNSSIIPPGGNTTDILRLVSETFSPNLDGDNDQLVLQYQLPAAGYVATMRVYDQRGHLLRTLYNNELLSTRGNLLWDGTDATGRRLPIGIYLVQASLFALDGSRIDWQEAVVLADFID